MTELPAGFTMRYAVRMPNGMLYTPAPQPQPDIADYWAIPSPIRDMLGLTGYEQALPKRPTPAIFDTRADAETLFKKIQAEVASVGVTNWGGAIVAQLCTPFTAGDAAIEFAAEVQAWLDENGHTS